MDIADAFQIVLELARGNAVDDDEAKDDPEILNQVRDQHQEALKLVEDFVTNQLGDD